MSYKAIQLLLLCFSVVLSVSACAENGPVETPLLDADVVKRQFQHSLDKAWETYTITEYVDKHDDKLKMLHNVFSYQLPDSAVINGSGEFHFNNASNNDSLHLGLVLVSLPTAEDAEKCRDAILSAQKSEFFEGSKILTEFFMVVKGSLLLLVYSESFMSKEFQAFKAQYTTP